MPQVEKSPVKIKTLFDFLWWMNFSLKWQHVSLRMFYSIEDGKFSLENNFIHFFSAKDFQKWSISNHECKIKETWKSYKYVAKECIYDFHKDEDYLLNKEKEQSLKDAIISQPDFLGFIKRPFKRLFFPAKVSAISFRVRRNRASGNANGDAREHSFRDNQFHQQSK